MKLFAESINENINTVNLAVVPVSSNGTYEMTFTAVSTNSHIAVQNAVAGTRDFYVDNFVVEEITTTGFLADIRQSTDYSPFGVTLEERNLMLGGAEKSRYGYQGSEMDNEVKGSGNSYTTEFRQLDPRLGRWLSIDPKATSMPWQSPYCSMDNNPIWFNDPLGDSIGIDETFQNDHSKMKAMEEMVKSKEGRDFLAKYAKKGQTIAGYTFTEDGEYHKKGIDMIFKRDNLEKWVKDKDGNMININKKKSGGGETNAELKMEYDNGIGKVVGATITITLHSGKGWHTDNYTFNSIITLFHESFIHGALFTDDYLDDKTINYSNMTNDDKERANGWDIHYQHKHVMNEFESNKSKNGLWPQQAFNVFKRIAKEWNLGYSDEYIQKGMWEFSGGY